MHSHVCPPCPGCNNPESCARCWMRLSPEDKRKLLAGRRPGRAQGADGSRATRKARKARPGASQEEGAAFVRAIEPHLESLETALLELELSSPAVAAAARKLEEVRRAILAAPHPRLARRK
jgi:hypothetical protein